MFGNLLHRMLFWELARVFALALTSITGLFLIGLVVQQANQLGLSLVQTLASIPLLVPVTLPYTIPATVLFATCVVYGRLSKDNEAVALKAAGVDLFTVLKPAVALGLLSAAGTFALAHSVIPQTQMLLQAQLLKNPEEVLYNWLKRDRTFRPLGNFPYVIHVKDVQGRRLIDVVIKRKKLTKDGTGKDVWHGVYDFVARAREAKLRVEFPPPGSAAAPTLYIDPDRWVAADDNSVKIIGGSTDPIGVPLPDVFSPKELQDRPINLTWDELPGKAAEFEKELADARTKLDAAKADLAAATDPTLRRAHEENVRGTGYVVDHFRRQVRNTWNEYYMRPALAVGCLVFAVVGVPVGMWANRADYLSAFVMGFLPTVFVYYPLLLAGSNMGRDGKVPIPVGVFLADMVGGLLSVVLVVRLIKR